ncbi:MAG: alpha/beta fold hydrolase [Acidobacteria bacterium]|nr:alpha/beta fold hydrolase [Acidobacteriota bacterium]
MRVLEAGAGRPLVLLHPFPLDANYWAPQLAAPPAGWRLIAPDLRGFGTQGAGDAPAESLEDHARDVFAMLDARRIDRAVVAGVSMGGYVAFAMLRLNAARVGALVLANTRMDADPPEGTAKRQAMLDLIAREGSAGVARDMPPLLGASTMQARPELVARVRASVGEAPAEGMAAAVRAMMRRPGSEAALAAFPGPVLIVSGSEDALTPPPLQEAMRAAAPGAVYETIERAGHLASLEAPAAFNAALLRFLHTPGA